MFPHSHMVRLSLNSVLGGPQPAPAPVHWDAGRARYRRNRRSRRRGRSHGTRGRSRGILVIDTGADGGAGALLQGDPPPGYDHGFIRKSVRQSDGRGVSAHLGIVVSDEGPTPVGKRVRPPRGPGHRRPADIVAVGEHLRRPLGIAEIEANGDILIADPFAANGGAVIRINPMSGAQALVCRCGRYRGPPAAAPDHRRRWTPTAEILVVENNVAGGGEGFGQVVRIDPFAGTEQWCRRAAAFLPSGEWPSGRTAASWFRTPTPSVAGAA